MKSKVLCVVMGGGRGSRLYPLTKLRSKPAVPLAGKFRLVDIPISNCLNSGLNQIYVLTQFNTASLHRHIQDSYRFDPFSNGFVDILSAEQTEQSNDWYQGTADAVRHNLMHFDCGDSDLFLILSGDQLYRMDFQEIIRRHRDSGAEVTVAAKPLPKAEVEGLGLMRVKSDLEIAEFVEKPTDPAVIDSLVIGPEIENSLPKPSKVARCLASMGIYVFNKESLYDALLDVSLNDFGKEIIPGMLGKRKLGAFIFDDYWEDIGTIRAFFEANLALTDTVPPFNFFEQERVIYTHTRYLPASKTTRATVDHAIIADGCILRETSVKRAVIGVRSIIREGTRLENVVMMGQDFFETPDQLEENHTRGIPNMGIGQNCVIEDAIIDKNARIGNNVKLSPKGKPERFEQGDIVIRDGVLIVTKNAIIPDNTVV